MVDRYDPRNNIGPVEGGPYVRHADYATLQAEVERLRDKAIAAPEPLEWVHRGGFPDTWDAGDYRIIEEDGAALTATLEEAILRRRPVTWAWRHKDELIRDYKTCSTLEAAKAAAQADYEARILSALAAPPAAERGVTKAMVERVAWAMAKVIAKRHDTDPDYWMGDERREEARAAIATFQTGEVATELLGPKPGERAAQGTPADAKAGGTSPSNPSVADPPAKAAEPAWRPMDSAPKDGTRIQLWHITGFPVYGSWRGYGPEISSWRTDSGWLIEPVAWFPASPSPTGGEKP